MNNTKIIKQMLKPLEGMHYYNEINYDLMNYLVDSILPVYENKEKFDKGHDIMHILDVTKRTCECIADNNYNVDINISIASAIFHDTGMIIERKGHAKHSAHIVKRTKSLKNFFNENEIDIIAKAVADHSTSLRKTPSSLYGKILSDADKDDDVIVYIIRAIEFSKQINHKVDIPDIMSDVYQDLNSRFGENGKVVFYTQSSKILKYKAKTCALINSPELFKQEMESIFNLMELCERHNVKNKNRNFINTYRNLSGMSLDDKIDLLKKQYQEELKKSNNKEYTKKKLNEEVSI